MKLSKRVEAVPYSAIRKLTPLANEAKKRGKKIYHLNVGEPDVKTPDEFFNAIKNVEIERLAYAPSKGMDVLLQATSDYYKKHSLDYNKDEIVITSGASEALTFTLYSVTDPEMEFLHLIHFMLTIIQSLKNLILNLKHLILLLKMDMLFLIMKQLKKV